MKITIFILIVIQVNAVRNIENNITFYEIDNEDNTYEKFNNITSRQSGHITFEGQTELEERPSGFIKFEEQSDYNNNLISFENKLNLNPVDTSNNEVSFGGENYQQQLQTEHQQELPQPLKKKRRRRKPKRQNVPGKYGFLQGGPHLAAMRPVPNLGPIGPYTYPGGNPFPSPYRPPRRRKPANLAEDTLTSVTNALGSIAQYDDYQCVPRLLCEVAGGKSPVGNPSSTSSILPSFIDLQPLITLLAAFNGLSSSPLFVFGRAVFLGVTSKGNTGTCRYAYPLCPTDPDKLVDYLNNHNGGFFRFFNGVSQLPQNHGQQGLQQFYSQLSGIPGQSVPYPQGPNFSSGPSFGGNYGLYNPVQGQINPQYSENQNYGSYNPEASYGLLNNNRYQGNYGINYPYNKNANVNQIETNKIEKRIQNKPGIVYLNTNDITTSTKLTFPTNTRVIKSLRFPEEVKTNNYISYNDYVRNGKGFQFPGTQTNRHYIEYYNYPPFSINLDKNKFKLDPDGYYVEDDSFAKDADEGNEETIYVLRGNGDPNNPEVIKLKPGEKISNIKYL